MPNLKNDTVGLGYEGKAPMKRSIYDFVLQHPFPPLYQTFQSFGFLNNDKEEEDCLLESVRNLFIIKDYASDSEDKAEEDLIEKRVLDAVNLMLKFGYEPGKGLGTRIQGATNPVKLQPHTTTFGLGYVHSVQEYLDWESPVRKDYYPLPNPLPSLHQTFQSAGRVNVEVEGLTKSLGVLSLANIGGHSVNKEKEKAPMQSKEEGITTSTWIAAPSRPRRAFE